MDQDPQLKTALFVGSDLLFAGKIESAAGPLGLKVQQTADLSAIKRALAESRVVVVLFDLNQTTPTVAEVVQSLPDPPRPFVVAFGPHINTVRLEEARNAGCDRVLPRSRFNGELPELLKQALDADSGRPSS